MSLGIECIYGNLLKYTFQELMFLFFGTLIHLIYTFTELSYPVDTPYF